VLHGVLPLLRNKIVIVCRPFGRAVFDVKSDAETRPYTNRFK
jgi:hypothetical protein